MRVKNSLINIGAGLANQVIITLLSFVSRTVFISTLGIEYLGVNGLFTNILAMLTLAEAGIGTSIIYSLYKPVAENDYKRINILMNFYKKTYLLIALIVLGLGLLLMPFLDLIIKDAKVENVHLIYLIFLLNTVAPYFYVYKNSFLNVAQKGYIVTGFYSVSSILSVCLKIVILYFFNNYIIYLIIDIIITISNSIILALIVNKMYPFLKDKVYEKLDLETKENITKNVKAIILQNFGNYLIFGTDNIIISSFVSVAAVGLYSNYNMLIEICRTFINQIFNNVYHSVGNLVARENIEKIYSVFKIYRLLNFWLYSLFSIFLTIMLEPFITIWIGKEFLLDKNLLLILMLIFYERGMRNAITTLKTTSGIFHEDRFAPIIQSVINLTISIILVQRIGITGVFVGTLISVIAVPFWTTPYLVYKKILKKPLSTYFNSYLLFLVIGVLTYFVTNYVSGFIRVVNPMSLLLKGTLCFVIPNIIYVSIYYKTDEFKYLIGVITIIKNNFQNKIRTFRSSRNVNKPMV